MEDYGIINTLPRLLWRVHGRLRGRFRSGASSVVVHGRVGVLIRVGVRGFAIAMPDVIVVWVILLLARSIERPPMRSTAIDSSTISIFLTALLGLLQSLTSAKAATSAESITAPPL